MPASFGYHRRYLRIDLTAQSVRGVELPDEVLRRYIGGSGLGTWILRKESSDGVDPLSPAAPLVFIFSPLVGSPLTTSAKFALVSKSPLTNRINDSLSSSHFAISGKKTGYDALVIVGAADAPTCAVIDDAGVRFENADDEWGRSVPETADALKHRLGTHYRSAVIGPAGENGVRFATVSHDGRHAGRGGTGAVMGAKRLKAICVHGTRSVEFAHPRKLTDYARRLSRESFGEATAKYRELGTVSNLLVFNRLGTLPTRNFQSGTFDGADAISPQALSAGRKRTRESCAACTIGCEHIFELPQNGSADLGGVRLEYENLFALGPLCGVSDPDVVLRASRFCDDAGMDTISAGGAIAFAMECAERGLIDAPRLRFGNGEALLETLRLMSVHRGIGELLSLGTRAAAEEIGAESAAFAPHVKGLEVPGYEPRALPAMALGFAVGTRGADHNRSGAYQADFSERGREQGISDTVAAAIETENEAAVMDSLILCKFLRGVFDDRFAAMAEMLSLVTGWDVTAEELHETAGRIVTAKKRYNISQGWAPEEDTLPARFFEQPLRGGVTEGAVLSRERLNEMIRAYNTARGWSPEGWVREQTVTQSTNLKSLIPIP
ncbi:MAG: aldehyde ferredoxin oxidoreductase family protein [Planctomycetaceae bacterium]